MRVSQQPYNCVHCDKCECEITGDEKLLGWPVVTCDSVVCPGCYGDAAFCRCGNLLPANIDHSSCGCDDVVVRVVRQGDSLSGPTGDVLFRGDEVDAYIYLEDTGCAYNHHWGVALVRGDGCIDWGDGWEIPQ